LSLRGAGQPEVIIEMARLITGGAGAGLTSLYTDRFRR
jgi:hypothetical protein